jgi:hypothetical protein
MSQTLCSQSNEPQTSHVKWLCSCRNTLSLNVPEFGSLGGFSLSIGAYSFLVSVLKVVYWTCLAFLLRQRVTTMLWNFRLVTEACGCRHTSGSYPHICQLATGHVSFVTYLCPINLLHVFDKITCSSGILWNITWALRKPLSFHDCFFSLAVFTFCMITHVVSWIHIVTLLRHKIRILF